HSCPLAPNVAIWHDMSTRRSVRTQMGDGGRLVIPAEFRRDLGLLPGAVVVISETEDGDLRVSTPAAGLRRARALVRQCVRRGDSRTDELLAERRREAFSE